MKWPQKTSLNRINRQAQTLLRNICYQVLILKKTKWNKLKIQTTIKKHCNMTSLQVQEKSVLLLSLILTKNRLVNGLLLIKACFLKLKATKNYSAKVKAYRQLANPAHMTWPRQVNSSNIQTQTAKRRWKLSSSQRTPMLHLMLPRSPRLSRRISPLTQKALHGEAANCMRLN